jgi:hypothetical protein
LNAGVVEFVFNACTSLETHPAGNAPGKLPVVSKSSKRIVWAFKPGEIANDAKNKKMRES